MSIILLLLTCICFCVDTIDLPAIKKKVSKALKVRKLGTGSSIASMYTVLLQEGLSIDMCMYNL